MPCRSRLFIQPLLPGHIRDSGDCPSCPCFAGTVGQKMTFVRIGVCNNALLVLKKK